MSATTPKGPWTHRWLVRLFTVLFGVLAWWLLGFVMDDISTWPGPDYTEIEERLLDSDLVETEERLEDEIADVQREITAEQARQRILRDSTDNAQRTMEQLLEFQRLSLEKEVTPTEEEQLALAESQQRFLSNQSQYQELTEEISQLEEQLRDLESQERANEEELYQARIPVSEEYERQSRRHDLILAAVKLAVLVPLLLVGIVLFLKRRESLYVPLVAAFAVAVAVRVMWVMHDHFPARYFKYVLIVTFLVIVTQALISLLRMVAFPKADWLNKQYREAYETFLCPVCSFPIRRGPLKFLYWTRRTLKKLQVPSSIADVAEEPYSCPSCSTQLFEECSQCGKVRHSLLPTCCHCGAVETPVGQTPEPA